MSLSRLLVALAIVVVGGIGLLECSGRQPDRDAVAAAEAELGIDLASRRLSVGDVELFVVEAGPADGPLVVLLHGFPEFWYAWRGPMAGLAAAGFRVAVPDQRGYDLSDKPEEIDAYRVDLLAADIAALIPALGYESAFVAGHDWGGGVAWNLAIRHPERVRRLAVVDTPHPRAFDDFESDEDTVDWFRTFFALPWLPERAARLGNWRLGSSALRDTSLADTFPEATMDLYRSAWDRDDAMKGMIDWYRASYRDPPPDPATWRVALPTLVMLAPGDVYIPAAATRRSMRWLDDGRLVELEEGTHWVIQERPARIAELLVEFFVR